MHKVEHGNLNCEIGITFEVAALVGIKLFDMDAQRLSSEILVQEKQLSILPSRIRKIKGKVDDNF